MTLTWADIDARWPDAGVLWDRDVAPTLDWEPRFEERDGVLWAGDVEGRGQWFHHVTNCRCLVWIDGSWISHHAHGLLQMERAAAAIAADRVDPQHVWVNPDIYLIIDALYPVRADDYIFAPAAQQERAHLLGSRAQRKRKRAALMARR